jgi:hypothetical protein
VSVNNFNRHQK